ncbi:MAG: hypothetical protein D3X82_10090 [Candidatus Leucobacter sulfamidivorax]|nr:hypothetical protein [Candidatus Leucobacter sulfamidivorax]
MSASDAETPGRSGPAWARPADVVDLFVYVVVLNLAAEYLPLVITETFTLSLLTALLLKIVLEVVVRLKNRIKGRFKAATSLMGKILAGLLLWVVLVGSKFVVLEAVALLFAGRVQLGGFFAVTGLILALLIARAGVRWLLGEPRGT